MGRARARVRGGGAAGGSATASRAASAAAAAAHRGRCQTSVAPSVAGHRISVRPPLLRAAAMLRCRFLNCPGRKWPEQPRPAHPSPGAYVLRPAARAFLRAACASTSAAQPGAEHTIVSWCAAASAASVFGARPFSTLGSPLCHTSCRSLLRSSTSSISSSLTRRSSSGARFAWSSILAAFLSAYSAFLMLLRMVRSCSVEIWE